MSGFMRGLDVDGSIDWVFPGGSESVYMVFTLNGVGALPYGPFEGPDARQEAEAFAERHIAPYSEQWSVVPMQGLALYRRLDRLREHLTERAQHFAGEAWTPGRVCEWASFEDKTVPGTVFTHEAEALLGTLAREGVVARQGRRSVWILTPPKEA